MAQADRERPRIGGLLAYLVLLLVGYPLFVAARMGIRAAIIAEAAEHNLQWRAMAGLGGLAVLVAAICFWFAALRLSTRRDARTIAVAIRCIWGGTLAVILLDYLAIGIMAASRAATHSSLASSSSASNRWSRRS